MKFTTLFGVALAVALFPGSLRVYAQNQTRASENLDFHWHWKAVITPRIRHPQPLVAWRWRPAARTTSPKQVPAGLAESAGWQPVKTGTDVFHGRVGYAWFQIRLPQLPRPNRVISFESVDDNGTVYLNGKKLFQHQGWNQPFLVPLDSAWHSARPNVLTVLVQNTAGGGGIMGAAAAGYYHPRPATSGVPVVNSTWRRVKLPNDYIVRGKFSPDAHVGHGYLPTYPAWYERTFRVPAVDKSRMLWLDFQGVYRDAHVYLNGHLLGDHRGGYTGFRLNITGKVHFNRINTLAVRVDPTFFEGWWYEGGGINRNVKLIIKHKLHVARYGTYVISRVPGPIQYDPATGESAQAELTIQTDVRNDRSTPAAFAVESVILDSSGKQVAKVTTGIPHLEAGATFTLNQHVTLARVALWSLHHTHLYHLRTSLYSVRLMPPANNLLVRQQRVNIDSKQTTFGIRTIRFDPNRGFFLNGRHVEMKGTCNHADFPAVGIGAPNNLWWWRVMMLKKELHSNAYRTSHNPVSPAFYRACDHLGMLVMDENRHPTDYHGPKASIGQPYHNMSAIKFMILRDRNHPSVIMWSMCNEEWGIQASEYGKTVFRAMMHEVHKFDRTRPITCAMNGGYPHGFTRVEDLQGINYHPQDYAWMHKMFPHLPIFGSEIGSTCSDRGVLASSAPLGLVTQYTMHTDWSQLAWDTWKPIATQPFVAGGFNWTGFDYRGEPTPYAWPDINSHFGLLDICGFPKPDAYYYKAWWGKKPLVYICPQWNLPSAMIGQKVLVRCFGNCSRVQLLLNGKQIGPRRVMPEYEYLDWQVPYQPGKLVVRGYNHGRQVAEWTQRTSGPAAGLRLTDQWPVMRANGEDIAPIAVAVVDAHGNIVTNADNKIHFSLTGPGRIVGSGNGDPACHEPNQADYHRAFYGHCMVMVQASRKPGVMRLTASARGLKRQTIELTSR